MGRRRLNGPGFPASGVDPATAGLVPLKEDYAMFAIVRTGGKQYRVAPGDRIVVEKLSGAVGDRIELGDVLLAGDGSDLKPTDGLKVAAEIVGQGRGEKIIVFKKKRRHNYRRRNGHRQYHTQLQILSVGDVQAQPRQKAAQAASPTQTAPVTAEAPTATTEA